MLKMKWVQDGVGKDLVREKRIRFDYLKICRFWILTEVQNPVQHEVIKVNRMVCKAEKPRRNVREKTEKKEKWGGENMYYLNMLLFLPI